LVVLIKPSDQKRNLDEMLPKYPAVS
jgi:hypothetical protein